MSFYKVYRRMSDISRLYDVMCVRYQAKHPLTSHTLLTFVCKLYWPWPQALIPNSPFMYSINITIHTSYTYRYNIGIFLVYGHCYTRTLS